MMRAGVGILVFLCGGLCVVGGAYGETPVASFTAESTSGGGALTVWFTDTSNTGTLESGSWLWDFGDGSTDTPEATLQHPAHYYEYPGTYSVSLTVTTDDGSDTFTQTDLVTVDTVPIFRVDIANTSELETGLTWPNAFNTIQEGVDAASAAGGGEVWVAQGTYTDNVNAGDADALGDGDDYCVVWMKDNVVLFGGFNGTEEYRYQRDPENQPTVIDGENTRRGVIANSLETSVLDGFTVRQGFISTSIGMGGAIYATRSLSLGINDCIFAHNVAQGISKKPGYGGAISSSHSNILVSETDFSSNMALGGTFDGAAYGGALHAFSSRMVLTSSSIKENTAKAAAGHFGFFGTPGKGAFGYGGGICAESAKLNLLDCSICSNRVEGGYGGPDETRGASGGDASGGGMYAVYTDVVLRNSPLSCNIAEAGKGGNATNIYSTFSPPSGGNAYGGGIFLRSSTLVTGCPDPFSDNRVIPGLGGATALGVGDSGEAEGPDFYLQDASGLIDEDGDGLPCWLEEEQGCDPNTKDAALWTSLDFPSPGSSFRSIPIPLLGRVGSEKVTKLWRSQDRGNSFIEIGAPDSSLNWSNEWSPTIPGGYAVVIRGMNTYGGYQDSVPRLINYQPSSPEVFLFSPIHQGHISGQVSVVGTAAAGVAGFGGYTLEYRSGTTPEGEGAWTFLHQAPNPVANDELGTWNVLALPEGWYVLRLRANDGAGTESKTWVAVYVDHDVIPPAAPTSLQIKGVIQPELATDGGAISVTGQGDRDCCLDTAELLNEDGAVFKVVTNELMLHTTGALRGECRMPAGSGASHVALRARYRDLAGNVGPFTTSNYLVVDNGPPTTSIDYLPDNTQLWLNSGAPTAYTLYGTAVDSGISEVALVEIQINDGPWEPATGTDSWQWIWTPAVEGVYTIRARSTDYQGNVSENVSIKVTVSVDNPTAYIMAPAPGSVFVSGTVVNIMGSASDGTDFQDYQVRYKGADDPVWTLITPAPVTNPVQEGVLAVWDTTGLTSPDCLLQLVVRDTTEHISVHTIALSIVANLSISGIPDVTFYEGSQFYRYAYLPEYTVPREVAEAYTYRLAAPLPPSGMGISIDGEKWLHILPETDWYGWADVTVQVEDLDGCIAEDTFRVQINNINDAPTAPVLSLSPAQPGDDDTLICSIAQHAADPDGTPFQYIFEWYRSRDGVYYDFLDHSTTQGANFAGGNQDTLSPASTTPGDYWQCVVRGYDGTVYGASVRAATRILQESSVTLAADPLTLTLGAPVTLTGQISGLDGIAPVGFTSVSPGGVVSTLYPEGTVCDASGAYARTFHPREATEGRVPWQLRATWSGDASHKGAASAPVGIDVIKAQPSLALAVSHSAALPLLQDANDFAVEAVFHVPGFPSDPGLLALYDGIPVRLAIQTPDGQTPYTPLVKTTSGAGRVSFTKADLDAAGVSFDQPGSWRFKADFLGDPNFLPAATADFDLTEARLTIKEGAGYAIVALGRLDENAEGHAEHAQTADFVYATLRARGFEADDIAYLRDVLPDDPAPVPGVSFLTPDADTLQQAIEVWARDKMLASPGPLYLVLLDHGSPGVFHLDIGGTPEQEFVSAVDVDGWLSVLQSSLGQKATGTDASEPAQAGETGLSLVAEDIEKDPGKLLLAEKELSPDPFKKNGMETGTDASEPAQAGETGLSPVSKGAAADQPIVVMYGACYSGSFLPVLSQEGRVVLTSTAADEISYRGVLNQETGVRDGEFFLMELFRNLGAGRSLKDAFELACTKTYDYTNTRSNGGTGDIPQHPLLDDNGDGTGTTGLLSSLAGLDGANAAVLDLGLGSNAGMALSWFTASPPGFLEAGASIGEVLAQTTGRLPQPGDTAWLEIKTPAYDSGVVATPGYETYQRVAAMTGPVAPTELRDPGGGAYAYAWTQATLEAFPGFDGFTQPGTYKLYYFLRDGDTGQVGAYLVTNIYVARSGNTPPNPVTLVYPGDGATAYTRPLFAWNPAVDPEGDAVTYHLQISTDPNFAEADTLIFTTTETQFQPGTAQALQDLTRYYWRVVPVDAFGAKPVLHEVRPFTTDNANPEIPGVLMGHVRDGATQAPIPAATVQVLPVGTTAATTVTGSYLVGNLPQGLYDLSVSAPGYRIAVLTGIAVQSGRFSVKDVSLLYEGGNRPPVLQPIGSRQMVVGTRLELPCAASDPDPGDTLTWSLLNAPPHMTMDPQTGLLVYVPVAGDEGDHPIVVQVSDNHNPPLTALEAIVITVKGVNRPPLLKVIEDQQIVAGDRLELPCRAVDPDPGDTITWRLASAPPRMGINEHTGLLVYEPLTEDIGVVSVTVEITDDGLPPLSASESFTLTVLKANHAPVIQAPGDQYVTAGKTLTVPCLAHDPDDGDVLSWSLLSPPPRMDIDPATGLLTYRSIEEDTGTRTVTVQVVDNGTPPLMGQAAFTIMVTPTVYVSGPRYAVIGDRVELEYHGEDQPGLWHVQWEHEGTILPDQSDELLVIESVTLEDAGWYTATQISDGKAEPVSASFYLNVVEEMPMRWAMALAVLVCVVALVTVRMGRLKRA